MKTNKEYDMRFALHVDKAYKLWVCDLSVVIDQANMPTTIFKNGMHFILQPL